jgi:hypothetical protein
MKNLPLYFSLGRPIFQLLKLKKKIFSMNEIKHQSKSSYFQSNEAELQK